MCKKIFHSIYLSVTCTKTHSECEWIINTYSREEWFDWQKKTYPTLQSSLYEQNSLFKHPNVNTEWNLKLFLIRFTLKFEQFLDLIFQPLVIYYHQFNFEPQTLIFVGFWHDLLFIYTLHSFGTTGPGNADITFSLIRQCFYRKLRFFRDEGTHI